MRVVVALVVLCLVLGGVWFAAAHGIIPIKKIARTNPGARNLFTGLGLLPKDPKATPRGPAVAAVSKPVPSSSPALHSSPVSAPADDAQAPQPAPAPADPQSAPAVPTQVKLQAIYDTMSADDIARIAAKQPDNELITTLSDLDEKKAGEVLAALPVDRAARISHLMAAGVVKPARMPVAAAR